MQGVTREEMQIPRPCFFEESASRKAWIIQHERSTTCSVLFAASLGFARDPFAGTALQLVRGARGSTFNFPPVMSTLLNLEGGGAWPGRHKRTKTSGRILLIAGSKGLRGAQSFTFPGFDRYATSPLKGTANHLYPQRSDVPFNETISSQARISAWIISLKRLLLA